MSATTRAGFALLALALVAAGCARSAPGERAAGDSASTPAPRAEAPGATTPAFAGKVWRVTESTAVAAGTRYEFRAGGALVIRSPGSTPLEGTWTMAEGQLTMVEEGIPYRIDILALDDSTFRIRSNNPGTPVVITMERDLP